MRKLAIDILRSRSLALASGLTRHADVIALIVWEVEQGSGIAGVKNSLKDTRYEDAERMRNRATHRQRGPNWKGSNKNVLKLLESYQWIYTVEMD